jgi:hypothetical protein
MAVLTIPAGAVAPQTGDPVASKLATAAIANGKVVRYDPAAPDKFALADKNTLAGSMAVGLAVSAAEAAGEYCVAAKPGSLITFASAILTKGVFYFLHDSGDIGEFSDVASTDFYTCVGYAESTTTMRLLMTITQVEKP